MNRNSLNGEPAQNPVESDLEQARRESAGDSNTDPQTAMLEAMPESKRWDPVPGSTGRQATESPSEDEDDEGRSETEQLVEEGVADAEHDRMLQADRAAARKDQ